MFNVTNVVKQRQANSRHDMESIYNKYLLKYYKSEN